MEFFKPQKLDFMIVEEVPSDQVRSNERLSQK